MKRPRPPMWAWAALAGLLLFPLYLRYFGWALGACVAYWAPLR